MVNTSRLKRIFRMFRDADFHFIVTALTRQIEDDNGVLQEIAPSFTQKLGEAVMGYMDFVWFLYADKEGNRKLLTQPKGPYRVKTRTKVGWVTPLGKTHPSRLNTLTLNYKGDFYESRRT